MPSAILQKLGIHGRKTKLYKAFRELGRVRRTIFLCEYIQNTQVQQAIQQATTKIESYNSFCDWITFGGERIMTGDPIEQEKRVRYTTLIANNIMLHNVQQLTQIIKDLRSDNNTITEPMLQSLSPYMTDHIRRYGDFVLNIDNVPEPLVYEM
ncbi:Tn3 family transposase [Persicobacter psychrovividus]|uniref:Tn3 transposase DDE domain-containing protein n=1 Tax=Persicobacter psychrovividus TaxID=387638 RepID=A0ABM7VMW6_9BACT|nr:hypothetical protein PEPS_46400 [Persicobacter psychrovividus]